MTGLDGNAFSILGRAIGAMQHAGLARDEIAKFEREATAGDYDQLRKRAFAGSRAVEGMKRPSPTETLNVEFSMIKLACCREDQRSGDENYF